MNEDNNIFRRILRGMNKNFYEDFQDLTLRAYKLEKLQEENFQELKKIGIRRMDNMALQEALNDTSESDNDERNPYKNSEEVVAEIIRTKSNFSYS